VDLLDFGLGNRRGRPPVAPDVVELIVRMARDNQWRSTCHGARRPAAAPIADVGTFIRNHFAGTLAVDFFTVPTVTFDVLYVLVVLSLERRRLLHVNVTAHPYATWAAQQLVEAFCPDGAFRFLIRDRDKIFGAAFDRRVDNLGVQQLRIAPRSPWRNGYAESLVVALPRLGGLPHRYTRRAA
jgi:transposase InsO family protein